MNLLPHVLIVLALLPLLADEPQGAGKSASEYSVESMPPVVVQTVPASGDVAVDPATTELRVTFSKKMIPGNFAWVQVSKQHFPQTTGRARFEADERTSVLPVKLEPGRCYVIWLNKAPYDSFMDQRHHKAVPYLLVFETAAK